MANNRMYLACTKCDGEAFYLAKYYPSTGWYTNRRDSDPDMADDLETWLDLHRHATPVPNPKPFPAGPWKGEQGTMYGHEHIILSFEVPPGHTDALLDAIQKVVDDA